jgi:hypothetical protein
MESYGFFPKTNFKYLYEKGLLKHGWAPNDGRMHGISALAGAIVALFIGRIKIPADTVS